MNYEAFNEEEIKPEPSNPMQKLWEEIIPEDERKKAEEEEERMKKENEVLKPRSRKAVEKVRSNSSILPFLCFRIFDVRIIKLCSSYEVWIICFYEDFFVDIIYLAPVKSGHTQFYFGRHYGAFLARFRRYLSQVPFSHQMTYIFSY